MTWWNTDFTNRKRLIVSAASGNGVSAGYTVKYSCTGNDAADIYNDCLPNGNDFRIVYWNGSSWVELDRHLVTFSATEIEVWFKLQAAISGGANDDNYYVYYSNSGAGSPPADKDNIYEFYDDFESGFDTAKWERNADSSGGGCGAQVSSGILEIHGGDGGCPAWVRSKIDLPNKILVEGKFKVVRDNDYAHAYFRIMNSAFSSVLTGVVYDYYTYDNGSCNYENRDSFYPEPCQVGAKLSPYWQDSWFNQKLFYDGTSASNNVKLTRNKGAGEESITHTAPTTSENLRLHIAPSAWYSEPNHHFYAEWILVRQYVPIEPTVSAGSEQQAIQPYSFIM